MNVAWISTWDRVCGIADYSKLLWPQVEAALKRQGHTATLFSLDLIPKTKTLEAILRAKKPDIIHFQHEYGIWGGKNPPLYRFPRLVEMLRHDLPATRLVATAHTVLPGNYRYPIEGRGWQAPIRAAINRLLLPKLQEVWGPRTWGALDGVIVHSRLQEEVPLKAGARLARAIPHFVPIRGVAGTVTREVAKPPLHPALAKLPPGEKRIVVFGFFTPEKGQELAIEALGKMPPDTRLILAGGTRRKQDERYRERCLARARELRIDNRVTVTGFVENRYIDGIYAAADLVVAPFRETTGSGSLAQALARGAPILASDLPLNREIAEREPGTLALFEAGSAESLAREATRLLAAPQEREALKAAALRYAQAHAPARIAEQHVQFYRELVQR